MAQTIQQKIAETEARLQRLKAKAKADQTRQKIIVGSILINDALNDPRRAKYLADRIRAGLTRDIDVKAVADLLETLDRKSAEPTEAEA
ncbi:hypothetical protein ACJKIH_24555 (plasmid) [Brucella pseudogrignonensis]|uniref:hypothetical protein n=1 Tax=Brucella pseudogrignonensis TaxID=419475 RepID=UPI0038B45E4B